MNQRVDRSRNVQSEKTILALLLVSICLALIYSDALKRADWLLYDLNMQFWQRPVPDDIVLVGIDANSLGQIGRWPWPRNLHAELINILSEFGVRAIGLDLIFPEVSTDDPESDELFAQAIASNGHVVMPVLYEPGAQGELVETLSITALQLRAAGTGHVDAELDADGIARSVFLKAGLGSPRWSSLGLAMLELNPKTKPKILPGKRSPLDQTALAADSWYRDYQIWIPFAGPPGHFQQVAYVDVLLGNFAADTFKDKFVLIGMTAQTASKGFATPLSGEASQMSGVEFNANVLDTLQRGIAIQSMPTSMQLWLSCLLVLLPVLLYSYLPSRWALPVAATMVVLAAVVAIALLKIWLLWFPPAATLATLVLSYPLWSWRRLESAARHLFREQERARVTLRSIGDAVITTNNKGIVRFLNPAAERLFNQLPEAAYGQALVAIFQSAGIQRFEAILHALLQCQEQGRAVALDQNTILVLADGDERAFHGTAAPLHDQKGHKLGSVLTLNDVTEMVRMQKQLAYQATHDTLTGLPNGNLLQDRLQQAMLAASREDHRVAILFLDLDRFKTVNDGLGHGAGDELLEAVGSRLRAHCAEDDTVARLSGDEFVILFESLGPQSSAALTAQSVLAALKQSFPLQGQEIFVTASAGISLYPDDGKSVEDLLRNAHTAMYRAKENGRDNFQFYAQEMNALSLQRLVLERRLRWALDNDELELHYQPQVELSSGRVVGVETLMRWRDSKHGMVSPGEFIPLAEETGLIVPLGEWALRTACRQAKAWLLAGYDCPLVAVNLSARQFMQPGLTSLVGQILQDTALEPRYLDLEITESLIMGDVETTVSTLHELKALGVYLAIDDFGTGYSNLSYMKRFPLDCLKIDQAFVRDILTEPSDAAIASAVIAMAHGMGLKVIAEGVETEGQLEFFQDHNCDIIQGYYYSRPLPAKDMTELLESGAQLPLQAVH